MNQSDPDPMSPGSLSPLPAPLYVLGTNPYPWPYDGCLDADRVGLVICGAQHQLIEASTDAAAVLERLGMTAEAVRFFGGTVVWVRHGSRTGSSHPSVLLPVRSTAGWQLAPVIGASDLIIDAGGWDGCFASDLDHTLRSHHISPLALGGFASEITVDSTIRTLNDQGHECLVLVDGCAPIDPRLGERAHASVTMSGGIFGALGTSAAFIGALSVANSPTSMSPSTSEAPSAPLVSPPLDTVLETSLATKESASS